MRTYAGLDLIGLKEAGGWQTLASVERYAHVVPNEAAKAADRLPSVQNWGLFGQAVTENDPDKGKNSK
jgi:hypothetical protein